MNVDVNASAAPSRLPVVCCAPLASVELADSEAEATAQLFKALSDPHRVRIINLLANSQEAVCVCDITDSIGVSQPTASFHLKKLSSAGLVRREQRGTWAYYSLDRSSMKKLTGIFNLKGRDR